MKTRATISFNIAALMVALAIATIPVCADEMQDAMDRADILNFALQLGIEGGQAQAMIAPLERIERLVREYRENEEELLDGLQPTLRAARQALVEGRELDDEAFEALEDFQAARHAAVRDLRRLVDAEMQVIAGTLHPTQNAMLDWTAPEVVRPYEGLERRLENQRIAMGRMQEVAEMLNRVKYLDAFNFVTGRITIVNDYLSRYFVPNTEQFQQATMIVLEYTDEVRMLPDDEWQMDAMDISAMMLEDIGLMPATDPTRFAGTISWDVLYRIVINPQTLEVVRELARY